MAQKVPVKNGALCTIVVQRAPTATFANGYRDSKFHFHKVFNNSVEKVSSIAGALWSAWQNSVDLDQAKSAFEKKVHFGKRPLR